MVSLVSICSIISSASRTIFLPTIPVALFGSHSWVLVLADNSLNWVLANFLLSIGASHGASHCADRVAPYPEHTRYK